MKKDKEMERLFADTLIELPIQFECGGEYFNIYQKSLGKILLINRLREQLAFDEEALKINPMIEAIRICDSQKDIVLRIICYSTKQKRQDVFNERDNEKRIALFREHMKTEDMATLLLFILQDESETLEKLKKHFGLDKEQERKRKVLAVKNDTNTNNVSVGGVSVFGTIIDYFCARYHSTFDEVVWETSYVCLMMMYYDAPDTIHVTDEERKKLPASVFVGSSDVIDPSSDEGKRRIREMSWK